MVGVAFAISWLDVNQITKVTIVKHMCDAEKFPHLTTEMVVEDFQFVMQNIVFIRKRNCLHPDQPDPALVLYKCHATERLRAPSPEASLF